MSACHTTPAASAATAPAAVSVEGATVVYKVEGVGSAHCQGIVRQAVGALPQVAAVSVEIGTGLVTVTPAAVPGRDPADPAALTALDALVAEAVDEAGYEFAGRVPA
ncbi:heavy-metal-associated domain-containing protein [Streptomyces indicus]|uniref:Copper chaperone CopZ n=1 Tax=Streptomyces indicus TaxID=417292 RepID=A0A1G9CJK9_9ACTN|nr:heavy-metal-associated domain-containing protein [Streptomyces indicus]SDK51861.1 Copper chaperone CopZ [Streptomyces indicus]